MRVDLSQCGVRPRGGAGRGSVSPRAACGGVPCDARALGPRRTRFVRRDSLRSDNCASQFTKRADARGQAPCASRRFHFASTFTAPRPVQRGWHAHAFGIGRPFFSATPSRLHRPQVGTRPGDFGSAEKRSVRGGARSALRELTRRRLSERSEQSERSEFGDGHELEHRREPSPPARARTHEPGRVPACGRRAPRAHGGCP